MDRNDLKEDEMKIDTTTISFEKLPCSPTPFYLSQCVAHGDEILICGGLSNSLCYSYHITKKQYKLICSYPMDVELYGHCIIKLTNIKNEHLNEVTLLSFSGSKYSRHTLMMRYVSVWNDDDNETNTIKKENENCNEWIVLTDKDSNKPIFIGGNEENCHEACAVIGGKHNNLLFITYQPNYIAVLNSNTLQYIRHDILPIENENEDDDGNGDSDGIKYHCLVSTNNSNANEMILFCAKKGLMIKYNEDENIFQFHDIRVCSSLKSLSSYAYVYVNNFILFFGGEEEWTKEETEIEKQWIEQEQERVQIEEIKLQLEEMKQELDIKRLKRSKEIKTVIQYWIHLLHIKMGWIQDFDIIILRYILMRYFKPLKILQSFPNTTLDIKLQNEIKGLEGHSRWVNDAQFSLDGTMIISSSDDQTIRLWDTKSCAEIQTLEGHTIDVRRAQFSPNGKTIISCSFDQTIRLWDVQSGKQIKSIEGHDMPINDVQFSPNGKMVVSSSDDEKIKIWDIESFEIIKELKVYSRVMKSQFSPDNCCIVSCAIDGIIRIWDIKSGREIKRLIGHSKIVRDVKYFMDGETIVSCSSDKTIRIWDIKLGIEIEKLKGHSKDVTGVDVSPDGKTIISCSRDQTIRIWDRLL
ncbi:WD-40 repeat-containing protein [Reticulomyxa filosa]|uniref:WD-40 repeat-containing protein n=1 Tax=Reticulomyxa filosa TaxID=46433 RepID=X6N8W5_RETFI|nr:WD-40 repeat-containing protein [Reticulomyxa filosa]|eukprot:ETO22735.1 WD-40 repeat-containing protein [Reticulomyxa filosa]